MKRAVAVLIACLAASTAAPVHADQLQCNSRADAERAAALVAPGTIMLDYCSMCDAEVKVVRVREARVVEDCDHELAVYGSLIARTGRTFNERYDKRAKYKQAQGDYSANIDLAYAYVETAPNRFDWLGGVLGLKAQVNTRSIRLPRDLYAEIGKHPMPSPQVPTAERAPTRLRQLGFSLFRDKRLNGAIAAFDEGKMDVAQRLASEALDGLIAQNLGRLGPKRLPGGRSLNTLIEDALRERLMRANLPLRDIRAGYSLKALEELPLPRLERAMAVFAVWAAITAHVEGAEEAIDRASVALLLDPTTAADLYRRAPRAAALARFYAALYHLGVAGGAPRPGDAQLVTRRLIQQFEEQATAFSANYAATLKRLLR